MAANKDLKVTLIGDDRTSAAFKSAGAGASGMATKFLKIGSLLGAGLGVAGFAKTVAASGMSFEATLNKMAAVADVPQAALKDLSKLALKMGADTSFSAQEAADAMLELAKGGMSAAQIKGGALKETLTLAAAGGLDLASAAGYMTNALNSFGLKAKDAGKVAASLAGGANASTASVESLGQALGQVGPGAVNAGLSLQETVAALAAFDNAGIKGSDAGTSLKTMLTRLVPSTVAAKNAMKDLGLDFTNADGSFKSLSNVSQQLKEKLGGLSAEQRTQALTTIFGSDATRAASVLMKEGGAGLDSYIAKTSDLSAANKVAASTTSGTAGAMEQMKGSFETLATTLGVALNPYLKKAALFVTDLLNTVTANLPKVMAWIGQLSGAFSKNAGDTDGAMSKVSASIRKAVEFARTAFDSLKQIFTSTVTIVTALWDAFGANMVRSFTTTFNNVLNALRGVLKVIQGVLDVFIGVFTGDWKRAWDGVKSIISGAFTIIQAVISQAFNLIRTAATSFFIALGGVFVAGWNGIKAGTSAALAAVVGFITGLPGRASAALSSLDNVLSAVASAAWGAFRSAMAQKISEAVQLVAGVDDRIRGALGNLGGLLFGAGRDIIRGLISGISSMIGQAAAAAANAARAVADAAKSALGIKSPSRVFEGIGKNVGEGMIVGMDGTRRAVTAAASSLLDTADVAGMKVGGSGYVNSRLAATAGTAPTEKAVSYNVTINGTLDPSLTPDSIVDALRRMELLAPRG